MPGGSPPSNQRPLRRTLQALSRTRGTSRASSRSSANAAQALQAHHDQLVSHLKESVELLLRLPPSPTLPTNPFSPSDTATAATAATPAQPQPLAPTTTQPSVPVTLRAQPLQVAPTHAPAGTPGATTFQLPPPAQPVTTTYQAPPPAQPLPPPTPLASLRPTVLPREAIDWDFCDSRLRCKQSTRGAAFSDVSSAAHRLWGLFTPDSDPSVAFVQARATAANVSDELIRATNALVLALRHFHNNAGRVYVWNPTEYRLDTTAHSDPFPTTAATTAATPPHLTADTLTLATVPPLSTRTTTARSGPMTDDEHHAVTRQYYVVDMRKFTPLVCLPFPTNSDAAVYLGMFLASIKLAMREILTICDESGKQSFDTSRVGKGMAPNPPQMCPEGSRVSAGHGAAPNPPHRRFLRPSFPGTRHRRNRTVGCQEAAVAPNQPFRQRRPGTRLPTAALLQRTELNRLLHVPARV